MTLQSTSARPVTIYTVAERAGVSIATVSRVLQGTARSSAATRQKVLQAVEELDYVPLRSSRRPDTVRHETHGVVLPLLEGPWYSELLTGFETTASQLGQSVVVVLCNGSEAVEDTVRRLVDRVDGIVVANDTIEDALVRVICRLTPTVLIARGALPGCDSVVVENTDSARRLTEHLLGHGRTAFAFVGDPDDSHDVGERYLGFLEALRGPAGRGAAEVTGPVRVPFVESSGATVAAAVAHATTRPDALVCANDELAISVMACLAAEGVRVPEDVAVVGYDDIMASRYVRPGLTTVRQPTRALGRWAAIRLHERIGGRKFDVHPQVLPTRMVVRGSCGCDWDQTSIAGD